MRAISLLLIVLFSAACGSNPCANAPGGACVDTCSGQCVADTEGSPFRVMIWSGAEGTTPPACPEVASAESVLGFLDTPPSDVTCSGPCGCAPSLGGCTLPETMTANGTVCPGGGPGSPFDPPSTWGGACTTMDAVSSADSFTSGAPTVASGASCASAVVSTAGFTGGKTIALRCNSMGTLAADVPGSCATADDVCTYPSTAGFSICNFFGGGDTPCTDPLWPVKRLLFEPGSSCGCTCSDPVGEVCSTTVTAFEDSSCANPVGSATITSHETTMCTNVTPGSSLGSKAATVTYTPGACAPTLTKIQPITLCCLP